MRVNGLPPRGGPSPRCGTAEAPQIARALFNWFDLHGRTLPWRTDRSPYRVVVSEFMLQQTQVDRVVPIFETFVAAFPDFMALSSATSGDVLRAWRGLGYNSRAVRLHALARVVCERHAGVLPSETDALRALPGVGPYTASAIRAFAFDLDEVAFDTNVSRVVQRVFLGEDQAPPARAHGLAAAPAALLFGGARHGNAVNSALMDLGATLCTARAPKCLLCPLAAHCKAAPLDTAPREQPTGSRQIPSVPFVKTRRYLRGRIVDALRLLPPGSSVSLLDLSRKLTALAGERSQQEICAAADALAADGIVEFDGTTLSLGGQRSGRLSR